MNPHLGSSLWSFWCDDDQWDLVVLHALHSFLPTWTRARRLSTTRI